jgi:hypothetical protein
MQMSSYMFHGFFWQLFKSSRYLPQGLTHNMHIKGGASKDEEAQHISW